MRIGIYPGSFDPVHKGHIAIVSHLLNQDYVDMVLIVPTGNYWNKQGLTPVAERIAMLQHYENDRIRIETEFNELPYTYQLMRKLRKRYPEDELMLIMGADTIIRFDAWKHYKELLAYVFLVIRRDDIDVDFYMRKLNKTNYVIVADFEEMPVSSSYIREHINEPEKLDMLIDREIYERYRQIISKT